MSAVLDAIAHYSVTRPQEPALVGATGAYTYWELHGAVEETARRISEWPAGPVGVCAGNALPWILFDLACIETGRPVVPLPSFFSHAQINHALESAGATLLLTDQPSSDIVGESVVLADQVLTRVQRPGVPQALPEGTAKITYTSGTTSRPKGVCLSQEGMERVALSLVEAIGTDYAGDHLAVLPLAVLLENVGGLYTVLLAGGCYHVLPQREIGFGRPFQPDFQRLAKSLKESRAHSTILVPEILRGLTSVLRKTRTRLPALRFVAVGGARVAPALLQEARACGLPAYQGYGLSESASVVALNTPADDCPDSVGKILSHVDLSLSGEGEIILHQPALLGYVGEGTAQGSFPTGDLGNLDDSGHLHITGRKKNVIINAYGRNISPEWIESELLTCPEIGQAVVFGEARPALGALLTPAAAGITGAQLSDAVARINACLPEYAQIRHWIKTLPFTPHNGQLTGTGRPRRGQILRAYEDVIVRSMQTMGLLPCFFDRLVEATAQERNVLYAVPQVVAGLKGQISLETYIAYLTEAYHHVKHTVPLLRLCKAKLPSSRLSLCDTLDEYIKEEMGHEEWILEDIKNAGGDPGSVKHSAPRMATEFMISYVYDYITRINPVGFFGMVFVLEGTSTQLATSGAHAVMKSLNLSEKCFSYLLSHGSLDLEHIELFKGLMDKMEDKRDQQAIIHVARRVFILFTEVFRNIPMSQKVLNVA